ncbi:Uncharacterised protein [Mycobacteroides abscessus subsp. abscessus]|nr:Uncharacterised protein [Mycobacteroides abscessus subsp. abscessus]
MATSANCTGSGAKCGAEPVARAAYAAIMSLTNGPIDSPSAAMWWATSANTYSSCADRQTQHRSGSSTLTSKPSVTAASSCAAESTTPQSRRSDTVSTPPMICTGTPSTAGNTVRSTS